MNSYKKWTGEQRQRSLKLTNEAKKRGLLEGPKKCKFCGQEHGILHTHNANYDVTLELVPKMLNGTANDEEVEKVKSVLWPICWRCHMILHSEWKNKEAHDRYFKEVAEGKQYRPVYRHDFDILKENGF